MWIRTAIVENNMDVPRGEQYWCSGGGGLPAILLLSIYTKEMKSVHQTAICFALQHCSQKPRSGNSLYPSVAEWIKEMLCIHTVAHYSDIKRMKSCHLDGMRDHY